MERIIDSKQGVCHYSNNRSFIFTPDEIDVNSVEGFRTTGTATMLADGTVEFVEKKYKRRKGILIKKLPHGRLSATHDGATLLTIKIYDDENLNLVATLKQECESAILALAI